MYEGPTVGTGETSLLLPSDLKSIRMWSTIPRSTQFVASRALPLSSISRSLVKIPPSSPFPIQKVHIFIKIDSLSLILFLMI